MTQDQIRQAAEKYAEENAQDDYVGYAETDFTAGATQALTDGWNGPDKVPDGKTCGMLGICKFYDEYFTCEIDYKDGEFIALSTYSPIGDKLLSWRYDNARDIYELLKQQGII